MEQGDLPLKDSQKTAFFISGTLHLFFLLFLAAQGLFAPRTERSTKKIFVQSIALKTHGSQKAFPKKASPPQQEIAFSEPTPQPEKKEPCVEKKVPEPEEKESCVQEEKGEEKSAPASKEEARPQPVTPTPKKNTTITTSSPKAKTAPKHSSKAAQAPKKNNPTSTNAKKNASSTAKKEKVSSAPAYDSRLVAEALSRLDRSAKATQNASHGGGSGKGSSGKVSHVRSVGSLHSDTGISSLGSEGADGPEFGPATSEGCYVADLIRRLQLNIRLAEPGEIRVKLTLKKSGELASIVVVSCKNGRIKSSLLEKLKKVHFSPFGQSFRGESEHTFLLRLSNDLMWSCS